MALVVQISDLHIWRRGEILYGQIDTVGFLKAAVAEINRLPLQPDLVFVTGDLVNDGTVHEYEHVLDLLDDLDAPWKAIIGNHDDAANATEVLDGHLLDPGAYPWKSPCSGVLDIGELRIVGLNTARPGLPHGVLEDGDLAAARAAFDVRPDALKVIALHHPPVAVGFAAMDDIRLDQDSADRLAEVVRESGVTALWCGHLHRPSMTVWNGAVVASAPSTAHAIAFDLRDTAPLTVSDEYPGMLVHRVVDGQLTTHVHSIGDFRVEVVHD